MHKLPKNEMRRTDKPKSRYGEHDLMALSILAGIIILSLAMGAVS